MYQRTAPEAGLHPVDPLSDDLRALGVDLDRNAERHDEWHWQLGEEEVAEIARLREHLLQLPLVHATSSFGDHGGGMELALDNGRTELLPSRQYGGTRATNSYELDQSMGLDEYVFWAWGTVPDGRYGPLYLIKQVGIEFWQNCVVTPHDLALSADIGEMNVALSGLTAGRQAAIRESYLDKMLRGDDWLEIVTRKLWKQLGDQRAAGRLLAMRSPALVEMGGWYCKAEVKHFGAVDVSDAMLLDTRTATDYGADRLQREYVERLGFLDVVTESRAFSRQPDRRQSVQERAVAASRVLEDVLGWPHPDAYV